MEVKEEVRNPSLSNGFLVVGFPGLGAVGGLAGNFLVEHLKMRHVASVYDPRFPPTMVVRRGRALSPVRFYTSEEACGLDGKCERLVLLVGDVLIDPDLFGELAGATLAWAKRKGVRQVAVLEGYSGDGLNPKLKGRVQAVKSLKSGLALRKLGVQVIEEGVVSSPGAAFLLAADRLDLDCLALFVSAREGQPDAKAASLLLKHVDPLLPNIDLGSKAFARKVRSLERTMRENAERQLRELKALRKATDVMYA